MLGMKHRYCLTKIRQKSLDQQEAVKALRVWAIGVGGAQGGVGPGEDIAEIDPVRIGQVGGVLHLIADRRKGIYGVPTEVDDAATHRCRLELWQELW